MELKFKNKSQVLSMAVSPDGKWLAVGKMVDKDRNASLTIWDTATWKCVLEEEEGEVSSILSVSFNRDSTMLAYVTALDYVRIIDVEDMFLTREFPFDSPQVVRYAAHKDQLLVIGRTVSVLDYDEVTLWSYEEYEAFASTKGLPAKLFKNYYDVQGIDPKTVYYGNKPVGAAFCRKDSAVILTGNNDNKFSVYDIKSGKCIEQHPGGLIQAEHLYIDKSEKYLFGGGWLPNASFLWELPEMKRLFPEDLNEDFGLALSFCFHPSARFFVLSDGRTVYLRSISTGEVLMEKDIHGKHGAKALQFSVDGKLLITGGTDGRVIITDISEYLT